MGSLAETLDAKLQVFDGQADNAVDYLIEWLTGYGSDLIAIARGRHVTGHYRFGNRNFLEWDNGELEANAAEELADAIVYISRLLHRRRSP